MELLLCSPLDSSPPKAPEPPSTESDAVDYHSAAHRLHPALSPYSQDPKLSDVLYPSRRLLLRRHLPVPRAKAQLPDLPPADVLATPAHLVDSVTLACLASPVGLDRLGDLDRRDC
jgi:hypothetical protein